MSSCLVDLLRGFLFPKGPIWDIQGLTHAHARDWLAQAHCCFLLTKMLPDNLLPCHFSVLASLCFVHMYCCRSV